jgi:tRNA threonylcarbamoyl adenosine modification protein YeaZ
VKTPLLLALDTSTSRGSVAVGIPGDTLARTFLDRQGAHAAELIPAIDSTLREAGVELGELGGIVVGAGPGSFTGVRVAAATAKGLVRALRLPMWAFSSLAAGAVMPEALTAEAMGMPSPETSLPYAGGLSALPRCVLFDARAERVYAACYRFVNQGAPEVILAPTAMELGDAIAAMRLLDTSVAFLGDGAHRHQETLRDAGFPVLAPPAGIPTGDGLLHLMGLASEAARVENPARWEPEYLRSSGAQRGQA